jgi:Fic family protein
MLFIREMRNDELTPELILELHRIITENTLENPRASGRLRTDQDDIHVVDATDSTVLHTPPDAGELEARMATLCKFANGHCDGQFIHPAIRAILLHFALAYDHPFVDGNGRTARALFYWSMARERYWLMEYITISRILKEAPVQYARAFLYTETDANDTTYFIIHQMDVIRKAIDALHEYIAHKSAAIHATEQLLRTAPELRAQINHRQMALLNHALKHPGNAYHIQGHRHAHNVTYDTARTDLLKLAGLGWMEQQKSGKTHLFIAPADLVERIKRTGAKAR